MIDPSFDTVEITPEADERLTTMDLLQTQYDEMQKALARKIEQWEYASTQLQRRVAQIYAFEEALKHNEWDFDQDTLQSLADFFDITLDREFEVTVTVTFTGTVSVPYDYDIDDLENDLSASLDTHHYGNSSVTVDLSEDGMDIDYHEI